VLGLCLGMQLLGRASEEGALPGLGWIDARARRFAFEDRAALKVPHMGWNTVASVKPHPLLNDLGDQPRFYFVHSYFMECADPEIELGRTTYGREFCSAVAARNLLGVQFHPEKSHKFGMALLRNFAASVPAAC
jgi:glutamine amidotransferase